MKIALAQLNYRIGDFGLNTRKIIDAIKKAEAENADLIVFAELAICGYPPRDLLHFNTFIEKSHTALEKIAAYTKDIAVIIGAPCLNKSGKGKKLYNAAFFIFEKEIQFVQHKSLLPTYDVFDEYRYFEPGEKLKVLDFKDQKIGISICEDIWNDPQHPLYKKDPLENFNTIDLHINISASPFHDNQFEKRKAVLLNTVKQVNAPIIYVNHVGAQTELIFDGASLVMDKKGKIKGQMPLFEEGIAYFDTKTQQTTGLTSKLPDKNERIYKALVLGIKDYFSKSNFDKAILGLSGGIDSALTLCLAVAALGKENVLAVMLPSMYSSEHSINDSLLLAKKLGCETEAISIASIYKTFEHTLKPLFKNKPVDVTEENLQARIRGNLLMALSNKFGYILLNTSNKSELAVGYGTMYGDMCGGLGVLGDIYKSQVYDLAKYINREKEIIPENIINKAPSAELSPDQKDSDTLPDYAILDKILFQYIEEEKSPAEILKQGINKELLYKIIRMVNRNEYKRFQFPPILRISPKAFGMGRRFPIVGKLIE